jgi:hypothetical protein
MTWSKSGIAWAGLCTELPTLARCIDATESSLLPTARAGKTTNENEETWRKRQAEGKVSTPPLALAVQMLPTPTAVNRVRSPETLEKCAKFRKKNANQNTVPLYLEETVLKLLPTPTASDGTTGAIFGENDQYSVKASGNIRKTTPSGASGTIGLARTMMLATPAAADCQGSHGGGQGKSLRTDMHQYKAETGERGTLNPSFVCRMMGFPETWLEID